MNPVKLDYNKSLKLNDNSSVGFLPKDHKIFFNKSTICYGASGSGKSTVIREILYLLKDHIPKIVCFAPTNDVNETYTGVAPPRSIFKKITKDRIERIWDSQGKKAELYTIVNKIENMAKLTEYMKDIVTLRPYYDRALQTIYRINQNEKSSIEIIENNTQIEFADAKQQIAKKKEQARRFRAETYKNVLLQNRTEIMPHIMNEDDQKLLKYLDLDPHLLITFDDCMDELAKICKSYGKETEPVINLFFTQGRWRYITVIVASQLDTKIISVIRSNAFVSIFTEPECCTHFMENKTNSFSKEKKKRAELVRDSIFSTRGNETNYKKFVYIRGADIHNCFSYTIANIYDNFKFGDDEQWAASNKHDALSTNKQQSFLKNLQ
jgi:hypothetical protein